MSAMLKATTNPSLTRRREIQWLLLVVLALLIAFPFIVGALTESSPLGVARGERMIMRGESVRWQAVLIEVYILAILAMSYNLMFGFTGVISFGHALFFGLGGYCVGMALELTDLPDEIALIVGSVGGLALCALIGLLIGLVSQRLKGVYFAIFTLGVAELGLLFFSRLPETRAEDGFAIQSLPTWIDPTQNRLVFYYIVLAIFALTFVFIRRLVNSPTGAVFKAIRENEDRTSAIGYNPLIYKLIVIIIGGMLAALAGILQVILNKKVGPELLSITFTVDPLLMTIIGGAGTFIGPVLGASGLHLLDTTLREQTIAFGTTTISISDSWSLILGLIFIGVVLVFPQGIVGTWVRWRHRRRTNHADQTQNARTAQPSH